MTSSCTVIIPDSSLSPVALGLYHYIYYARCTPWLSLRVGHKAILRTSKSDDVSLNVPQNPLV